MPPVIWKKRGVSTPVQNPTPHVPCPQVTKAQGGHRGCEGLPGSNRPRLQASENKPVCCVAGLDSGTISLAKTKA